MDKPVDHKVENQEVEPKTRRRGIYLLPNLLTTAYPVVLFPLPIGCGRA